MKLFQIAPYIWIARNNRDTESCWKEKQNKTENDTNADPWNQSWNQVELWAWFGLSRPDYFM